MYKIIGTDGKEYGPVTLEQLRQWLSEGRVNSQTQAQVNGSTDWQTLGSLPEVSGPPLAYPPSTSSSFCKKPGKLQAVAVMTLICGIVNCLIAAYWLFAGLSIFLVGVLFTIIPAAYTLTLGIFEIITAAKLLSDPVKVTRSPKFVAVMEIIGILFCNFIALVIGILNLVFYNDEEVEKYFTSIRAQ